MDLNTYSIGIDIGGMSAKLALINQDIIVKEESMLMKSDLSYDLFINKLCEKISNLSSDIKPSKVGISSFGLIDSKKGLIVYANNVKWENKSIVSDVEKRIGLPVKITNDAKCAGLAEAVYGAGILYDRVCMITLGTGVGGGVVINKQLDSTNRYSDSDAVLGHITVVDNGKQCSCGRKGCLEAYASATAVMKSYKEKSGKDLSAEAIFIKEREGDVNALEVINEFKHYLSEGLISLSNILRPEVVIIGGGMGAAADSFLSYLNKTVNEKIFGGNSLPVKIVEAKLGNRAGMIGATLL